MARPHVPAFATFLIQLACGSKGYLPTEKAEKGSHYSAYASSGFVGHEGGDLLVRKSVEAINAFFAEKIHIQTLTKMVFDAKIK